MRRSVFLVLLAVLAVTALSAQAPDGWQVRIDRSTSASDPDNVPEIKVATAGKGFRVTGGPAGTFWHPTNRAKGNFTARASFNLMKPSGHTNYYGLIFGGEELGGANQRYIYFLVAQDGTFIIRQRTADKVQDVHRAMHAAVRQPGQNGSSTNALEVRVGANQISYVINGTVVHTTPRSGATAQTDGLVGVRVNHLLDVQVDAFEVQQG